MPRTILAVLVVAAWVSVSAMEPLARADDRPNILFIMADDHAAHAISAYGSRINKTPNIDRIAAGGVRLDRCFATNAICTPSRATILTGQYSHLNGVPVFNRFDGRRPNVAKALQAAGYHTGMVGKWHLGSEPTGFDDWTILPGQGAYRDPAFFAKDRGRIVMKGYCTDVITDLGIAFLDDRPRDRPFFLMLHHKAPHRPWEPLDADRKAWESREIPEPSTLFDDYATRSEAATEATMRVGRDLTQRDLKRPVPDGLTPEQVTRWKYRRYLEDYLACVDALDRNVGRVLDRLDQLDLAKDTLVIYTSDQGFFLGDHGWFDKRFMYEESLKMPFVARWPGRIAPGSSSTSMALNVDFAPTFLDAAGVTEAQLPGVQGRSLRPVLEGHAPADWRKAMYYRYYHYPQDHRVQPHYGIRTDRHKLIYFNKIDRWELYDLQDDPGELHNLAADPASAELLRSLKEQLARLKAEARDDDQFADEVPKTSVEGPPTKS